MTENHWIEASEFIGFRRTNAPRTLELNAYHAFASKEHVSGCVLACAAIESLRDKLLKTHGKKKAELGTSETDLLKHLTDGTERLFGRNFKNDDPIGYDNLKSLWIARGNAAHGKPAFWVLEGNRVDIHDLELGIFVDAVSRTLRWIEALN